MKVRLQDYVERGSRAWFCIVDGNQYGINKIPKIVLQIIPHEPMRCPLPDSINSTTPSQSARSSTYSTTQRQMMQSTQAVKPSFILTFGTAIAYRPSTSQCLVYHRSAQHNIVGDCQCHGQTGKFRDIGSNAWITPNSSCKATTTTPKVFLSKALPIRIPNRL